MSNFASIVAKLRSRSTHRVLAWGVVLPAFVTLTTGIVLLVRQDFEWLQPKSKQGSVRELPSLPVQGALKRVEELAAAHFQAGAKLNSIEIRPSKGTYVFRLSDGFEVQLDGKTGELLGSGVRRASWLIELHQGSWFHPLAMKWIFLPSGLALLGLWFTGLRMGLQRLLKNKQ